MVGHLNLEIMFRDGVPLNQHFMALKTKYNNEKEYYEKNDTAIFTCSWFYKSNWC